MSQVGQDMDELMDQLAHENRNMRFLRVVLSRQSHIPPMLGIPHAPGQLEVPQPTTVLPQNACETIMYCIGQKTRTAY